MPSSEVQKDSAAALIRTLNDWGQQILCKRKDSRPRQLQSLKE